MFGSGQNNPYREGVAGPLGTRPGGRLLHRSGGARDPHGLDKQPLVEEHLPERRSVSVAAFGAQTPCPVLLLWNTPHRVPGRLRPGHSATLLITGAKPRSQRTSAPPRFRP